MIFSPKYSEVLHINESTLRQQINQIRKIIFMMMEDPSSSKLARSIQTIVILTITISQVQIMLDSLYENYDLYEEISVSVEITILSVFTSEYLMRLLTCTAYGNSVFKFITQTLNLIDLISLIPFSFIGAFNNNSSLNALRILKLFRVVRVLKMARHVRGIQILQRSVTQSFKQFYFLIMGFFIFALAYAVILYYSENADGYSMGMGDAFWLGIVTMSTVGYGDVVPRSTIGMIISSFAALLANTAILALPIAILDRDFHEIYMSKVEAKQVEKLRLKHRIGKRRQSVKNKEFSFMNQRLELIEAKNREVQKLLDRSNQMAKELTKDLKKLFLSVNEDEKDSQLTPQRPKETNILVLKAHLFEKLVRAKRKIQVTNIFRNIKHESEGESEYINSKQLPQIKKRVLIKSHSLENENQLLKLRNEEFGQLPFEFLNEVLHQIQDDLGKIGNVEDSSVHQQQDEDQVEFQHKIQIFGQFSESNMRQSFWDGSMSESPQNKKYGINKPRKQSEFTTNLEKRSMLHLRMLQSSQQDVKCITENSQSQKKRKVQYKEVDDFQKSKLPRMPPEFTSESNNLKDIDSFTNIKDNSVKPLRRKHTWADFDGNSAMKHSKVSLGNIQEVMDDRLDDINYND